jgi:phosphoenolpyruvate---glycerone phosphotransferase subunit DhaL
VAIEELTLDRARSWIEAAGALVEQNATLLTELDTAIGDGDHGTNMARGFGAVRRKVDGTTTADIGTLLKLVGMTLLSSVGGAAGPLYGGFFLEMARATAGRARLAKSELDQVLGAGLNDIKRRGKAEVGDKTIVDALTPAVEAFRSVSELGAAFRAAADAAREAAEGTTSLRARKGRASYLGERSIGHQDPGATSCWLLLEALASVGAPK